MAQPKVLLMGCGGIGGIMAAKLLARGHDLVIVTHNPAIADAVNRRGLVVRGEDGEHVAPGDAVSGRATATLVEGSGPFDFVFLATQPPQVEEAARTALPTLATHGAMVCFQNGLCERRVAAIAGVEHTHGAIVAWGGSMIEPGIYERTSDGGFVLGRLDGGDDARLGTLRALLDAVGPAEITTNLRGARWSKLAINCAISSLGTIGGDRLGALLRHRFVRRLGLEVMTEVVEVARARGVRLEKVSGTIDLDWVALTDTERTASGSASLLAKHALLLAVGAKFRRLRSSMLQAIERGREPAVDYLNGEVVTRARTLGIRVPVNERIIEMIHAIARRTARPGLPLLRQLYADFHTTDVGPPRHLEDAAAPPM
ncbi:MAG TPA: ketopantoate reductase family protein [Candidatus Margulisiibacteriota bacterium]|nr:ketopantoate reductase family protein [Candidatus Margulisiibacteriota bacterium]